MKYMYTSRVLINVGKRCEIKQPHEIYNKEDKLTYTIVPAIRIKETDEVIAIDELQIRKDGVQLEDIEYIGLEYYGD